MTLIRIDRGTGERTTLEGETLTKALTSLGTFYGHGVQWATDTLTSGQNLHTHGYLYTMQKEDEP